MNNQKRKMEFVNLKTFQDIAEVGVEQYALGLLVQIEPEFSKQSPEIRKLALENAAVIAELFEENEFAQIFRSVEPTITPAEILSKAKFRKEVFAGPEIKLSYDDIKDVLESQEQKLEELENEYDKKNHIYDLWKNKQNYYQAKKTYNEYFPNKPPLNANIVGKIGERLEKLEDEIIPKQQRLVNQASENFENAAQLQEQRLEPAPEETVTPNWSSFVLVGCFVLGIAFASFTGEPLDLKDDKILTQQETGVAQAQDLTRYLTPTPFGEVFLASIKENVYSGNREDGFDWNVDSRKPLLMDIGEFSKTQGANLTGTHYTYVTRDDRYIKVVATKKGNLDVTETDQDFFKDMQTYSTVTNTEHANQDSGIKVLYDLAKYLPFQKNQWEMKFVGAIEEKPGMIEFTEKQASFYIKLGDILCPQDLNQTNTVEMVRKKGMDIALEGFKLEDESTQVQLPKLNLKIPDGKIPSMKIELLNTEPDERGKDTEYRLQTFLFRWFTPKKLLARVMSGKQEPGDNENVFLILGKFLALAGFTTVDFFKNVKSNDKWFGTTMRVLVFFFATACIMSSVYNADKYNLGIETLGKTEKEMEDWNWNLLEGIGSDARRYFGFFSTILGFASSIYGFVWVWGVLAPIVLQAHAVYRFFRPAISTSSPPGSPKQRRAGAQFPSRTDMESAIRATNGDVNAAARMLSTFPM